MRSPSCGRSSARASANRCPVQAEDGGRPGRAAARRPGLAGAASRHGSFSTAAGLHLGHPEAPLRDWPGAYDSAALRDKRIRRGQPPCRSGAWRHRRRRAALARPQRREHAGAARAAWRRERKPRKARRRAKGQRHSSVRAADARHEAQAPPASRVEWGSRGDWLRPLPARPVRHSSAAKAARISSQRPGTLRAAPGGGALTPRPLSGNASSTADVTPLKCWRAAAVRRSQRATPREMSCSPRAAAPGAWRMASRRRSICPSPARQGNVSAAASSLRAHSPLLATSEQAQAPAAARAAQQRALERRQCARRPRRRGGAHLPQRGAPALCFASRWR